jgi:heat shock protein HslJ
MVMPLAQEHTMMRRDMQPQRILAALAMLGGLMLAACSPADPAPLSLSDTVWILATLNGQTALSGTVVTLAFADGKITGTDGCNRYAASYTVSGTKLTVSKDMITTQMACPAPIMQQAAAYTTALTQAATYKNDGLQLALLDAGGKTLAAFTAQSKTLGGTSWTVTGYNNGKQAVVSVAVGSKLTAGFSVDGQVSGSAGCNKYTAAYQTSGQSITIGPAGSTRMMCADPAGVMEQESLYLKALQTAATYRMEGSQLELRTADGALAVTFVTSPTRSPQ